MALNAWSVISSEYTLRSPGVDMGSIPLSHSSRLSRSNLAISKCVSDAKRRVYRGKGACLRVIGLFLSGVVILFKPNVETF